VGGAAGLIDGKPEQVITQLVAVGATIAYAVVATFIIVKVVDLILGIRVNSADEEVGLDIAVHGEVAYQV
jgi:Amt family ammonium transporter